MTTPETPLTLAQKAGELRTKISHRAVRKLPVDNLVADYWDTLEHLMVAVINQDPPAPDAGPYGKPIDELNLSVRAENALHNAHFKTAGDLSRVTLFELSKVKNLGERSIQEVRDALGKIGLGLKETVP